MHAPRLPRIGTMAAWRDHARTLAAADVPPDKVEWGLDGVPLPLFPSDPPVSARKVGVPRAFLPLSEALIPDRDGRGMALAYDLLHGLQRDPGLLGRRAHPVVAQAEKVAKAVRRDIHKMHAFLRFREDPHPGARRAFTAWFEPDHRIEETTAAFFANRFGDMDWRIVTPEVTVTFLDGTVEMEAKAASRPDGADALETLWTTYYSNIFNPARLKLDAMRAEMPKKYWRNLPETRAIPSLIAGARARVSRMHEDGPTQPAPQAVRLKEIDVNIQSQADLFGPQSLTAIAKDASACTRCPLYSDATQVVFGEGPKDASIMFVGEQPGDKEDLAGRPFVGPAGQLFDEVAGQAGIDREACYVTNAVKHFKFVQRGKRRIHQKPAASEVSACSWWLGQEMSLVDPDLIVAMGATALHALTGRGAGILKRRGTVERTKDGRPVLITVHPSYLLRLPDENLRKQETARFAADLASIHDLLKNCAA